MQYFDGVCGNTIIYKFNSLLGHVLVVMAFLSLGFLVSVGIGKIYSDLGI